MSQKIYLINNIEYSSNYADVVRFENLATQSAYFDDKIKLFTEINTIKYIKPTSQVKVNLNYNKLTDITYCLFVYNNKRYYNFVDRIEYINENTTLLFLTLDVFQTFQFDYELNSCFIEREHQDRFTKSGAIIYNTVDENLDIGYNYVPLKKERLKPNNNAPNSTNKIGVFAITTSAPIDNPQSTTPRNHAYLSYITFVNLNDISGAVYVEENNDKMWVNHIAMNLIGQYDHVLKIEYLPFVNFNYSAVTVNDPIDENDFGVQINDEFGEKINLGNIELPKYYVYKINYEPSFADYNNYTKTYQNINLLNLNEFVKFSTPNINNLATMENEPKLYTYPYFYYEITNNRGDVAIIRNEYLRKNGGVYRLMLLNNLIDYEKNSEIYFIQYQNHVGTTQQAKEGVLRDTLNLEMDIVSNAYINYLQNKKASATMGLMASGASAVGSMLLSGFNPVAVGSAIMGVGGQVANEMIKRRELKDTPNYQKQIGQSLSFLNRADLLDYYLVANTITDEYKRKIYDYLYSYGYKANRIGIPNIDSRYYFNYVKTIDCSISSNLNLNWQKEIINIYNRGVRIWHYRNAQTYKGINNYAYENWEMAVL